MSGLTDQEVPQDLVEGVNFRVYTAEEIRQLSVKQITNPTPFDRLKQATFGGLYDPALGPTSEDDACASCRQGSLHCPGHMGHIELAMTTFNTVYFSTLWTILRASCLNCHRLFITPIMANLFMNQYKLLLRGHPEAVHDLSAIVSRITAEHTGNKASLEEMLNREVAEYVKEKMKDNPQESVNQKHIQALRNDLIQDIRRQHLQRSTLCPHCNVRMPRLKRENNAKIVLLGKLKTMPVTPSAKGKKIDDADKENSNENGETDLVDQDDDDYDDSDGNQTSQNHRWVPSQKTVPSANKPQGPATGKKFEVTLLTPVVIRDHLRHLWEANGAFLKTMYMSLARCNSTYPTDIFFLDVLPVPPSRFRPVSMMKGEKYADPQTENLARVLNDCATIRQILEASRDADPGATIHKNNNNLPSLVRGIPGSTLIDKLNNAWIVLQTHVNCVIDSTLDTSDTANPGIKQLLEKKEGLFRKFMMGKRVNYAARSVISPDPNLSTNEIGIPEVFAKVLTYPQPVTPWNVQELRQAVINGPDKHPGASYVMYEDGFKIKLKSGDAAQRHAIAKQLLNPSVSNKLAMFPKQVLRHLKNGDILLLNRQPTLHRPSIQAHRARVLPKEKTLRLHYANCKAYNADFDGDEMNAHFPQNELARAEAYTIAATDYQYLVPKDGTPLAGLIQDHMVSGVALTLRGRFFTRDDYYKLVYTALVDKVGPIKLLPPAMIKPYTLWSGKQVLSSVVLNVIPANKPLLSLIGKAKIPEKNWGRSKPGKGKRMTTPPLMGESDVVIQKGELLVGVLDKGHYGPTPFGLIHSCYELYGGAIAGKMLTCFGRLFINYLQMVGFTLGVEDILVTNKADKKRRRIIRHSPDVGKEAVVQTLDPDGKMDGGELLREMRDSHYCKDERRMRELDMNMRNKTNKIQDDIVNACMPDGLHKLFPHNNLQLMVQSGAKGSSVNCMQISCLLGQIELEGKRPPIMLSGRSLPSFQPYDMTPRAGGFVTGRFLTGIRQQEYFFHCMAGREGLIDTAVKTSRSGYLQRCIIKHMEGLKVNYDLTVRDCDSSIIQFYYGEDGLDTCKVSYLTPDQIPFLLENRTRVKKGQTAVQETDDVQHYKKGIEKWQKKHTDKKRTSGFLAFCQTLGEEDLKGMSVDTSRMNGRSREACLKCRAWQKLSDRKREKWERKNEPCADPLMTKFTPYLEGVIPEKQTAMLNSYAKNLKQQNPDISESEFRNLMNSKFKQVFVEPGEPVGLLCAQSIGEPSTQMTLNTFHFAGRNEMNVTLGIPRLTEILMIGSKNIKTPAMDVPVYGGDESKVKAKHLQKVLNKVSLAEVLKEVTVREYLSTKTTDKRLRHRAYHIRFSFLPQSCYKERLLVTPRQILKFMETKYIKHLVVAIKKNITSLNKMRLVSSGNQKTPTAKSADVNNKVQDDEDEMDEVDPNDGDAQDAKFQKKKQDEQEYDEDEETGEAAEDEAGSDVEMDDAENNHDNQEDLLVTGIDDSFEKRKKEKKKHKVSTSEADSRIKNILETVGVPLKSYKLDTEEQLWCELGVEMSILDSKMDMLAFIENQVQKGVVHSVSGITRCILGEQKGPSGMELHLKTEGINLHELYKHRNILDLDRIYCNDIHAVAEAYGIEAANRVVMMEVQSVFGAYGIQVDYRHLSLLADYMTVEGAYKPFNRRSLESSPSPFQKMSYESTMNFLVNTTIHDGVDRLQSPSSQIVLGKVVTTGTGCFECIQPLK